MKKMTVASVTEELGKLTEVVQNYQEKTDNTLSMIMNEIQEVSFYLNKTENSVVIMCVIT